MKSDWLLALVAGYTVYKIGWVDGFTAVNLFLVLCLCIAAAAAVLRHSSSWKRMKEKQKEEMKKGKR